MVYKLNKALYLKCEYENMLLISEIFVHEMIFGEKNMFCKTFIDQMSKEFEMTIYAKIKFFIGLIK